MTRIFEVLEIGLSNFANELPKTLSLDTNCCGAWQSRRRRIRSGNRDRSKFVRYGTYAVRNQTLTIFLYIAASAAISLFIPSVIYAAQKPTPPPEVWITVRKDGHAGKGTKADPYDGSTHAKFDRLMASFGQNTVIHLGPGTFQTDIAARSWQPLSGWKVRGAGMEVTTIQAVGTPIASNYAAFGKDNGNQANVESDNVEISDLTVDANYSGVSVGAPRANGESNFKCGLITLMGSNNLVQRVHGKNQYGSAVNGRECFGIRLAGFSDAGVVTGNRILHCLVDSPKGNYNAPYSLHGSFNTSDLMTNCEVAYCRAVGANDGLGLSTTPHTAFSSGGVNLADVDAVKIHDNIFIDCIGLVYNDTHPANRVEIYNNFADRAFIGASYVGPSATGWRLYNNTISIQARNGTGAVYGLSFINVTDLRVIGNKITWSCGGPGTPSGKYGINVTGTGTVANNIIDSHLDGENISTGFTVIHGTNKTEAGNIPKGLIESPAASRNDSTVRR